MSVQKQIQKSKAKNTDEYRAIIGELLRNIYGLSVVLDDMKAGKVSDEEFEKVQETIALILDNFGVGK